MDAREADIRAHCERVAGAVAAQGAPPHVVEAARHHDDIEDGLETPETLADMGLAPEARELVALLTRGRETYREYIEALIAAGDPWVVRVKLADIADNMSRNGGPPGDLVKRYGWARAVLTAALGEIT